MPKKPAPLPNREHGAAKAKSRPAASKSPVKSKSKPASTSKAKGKAKRATKPKAAPAVILSASDGVGGETVTGDAGDKGRPTAYKPEFARIARIMCQNGATDAELGDELGVTTVTIWRWQATHSDFCNALKIAKGEYDDRVERSLAQRALGYTYDAVKIFMPAGAVNPVYAPYREHVPPDPGAAKLWLTNRRGGDWREKSQVDHGLTGEFVAFLGQIDGHSASLV